MSAQIRFLVASAKQMTWSSFGNSLKRRKGLDDASAQTETKLNRCLTTFDLTCLGIGSTLGLGIYVLAGQVASQKAGPAVILSFAVAAIASLFAGLCYAEFGARVPKAGSAYVYSYITVGEFMAFAIGWNLVLEYLIGTASVARGYSAYIDSLVSETGWSFQEFFRSIMPINVSQLSKYPDLLASFITISLSLMLTLGAKESTKFNSIFTFINIIIVIYVIVCGCFKSDFHNWSLSEEEIYDVIGNQTMKPEKERIDPGVGGFFPFGISGMMAGAATCFYGYIGFDVIATTGEEAKNPQKSIPIAITVSLLIIFLSYFGISSVETLMWPYYDQNKDAPLPYVFTQIGWPVAKWIISIGALAGLSTSLLGAMFPLPRILYAMASDGLIYRSLANVHPRYKTPVLATIVSGLIASFLTAIFDVGQLADMMSIGTLLAYSLVALSVLLLRFSDIATNTEDGSSEERVNLTNISSNGENAAPNEITIVAAVSTTTSTSAPAVQVRSRAMQLLAVLLNLDRIKEPTILTAKTSMILIMASCTQILILDMILVIGEDRLSQKDPIVITVLCLVIFLVGLTVTSLWLQPQSQRKLSFKVPAVPAVPLLSIWINIYLMMKLSVPTWIRFGVWMGLGLLIYFTYGIFNSTGAMRDDEKQVEMRRRQEVFGKKPVLVSSSESRNGAKTVPQDAVE
jgi:cationic amino acid transport permease